MPTAFIREWPIAWELFWWKPNCVNIKYSVNLQLQLCNTVCSRCRPFFSYFNRFHIYRSDTGQNKELKSARPFAFRVIASLFNGAKNVRFQRMLQRFKPPLTTFIVLLSLSLIVLEPKTTCNTSQKMENICYCCDLILGLKTETWAVRRVYSTSETYFVIWKASACFEFKNSTLTLHE